MDYKDYFCKLECCYWHEFDLAYGKLDVKDKTITIIGNDCGSSALYFLLKRAKHVIGYEKEEKLNQLFKEKVCSKNSGTINISSTAVVLNNNCS